MAYRTIPIHPTRPVRPRLAPLLVGDVSTAQRLVLALQAALDLHAGLREPADLWLRELRLTAGEAELSLAPGLPVCGGNLAQAAFETLRLLLPDTDIYVRTAVH